MLRVAQPGLRILRHVLGELIRGPGGAPLLDPLNIDIPLAARPYPHVAQQVGVYVLARVDDVQVQGAVEVAALADLDVLLQELPPLQSRHQPVPCGLQFDRGALRPHAEGDEPIRAPALL